MNEQQKKGLEQAARFGIFSKGIVYILTGLITAMEAFGMGGRTTDQDGVFSIVLAQPFGRVIVAAIAAGLFAYMTWKLIQAAADSDRKGKKPGGRAARIGQVAGGLFAGSLGSYAVLLVVRSFGGSGTLGSGDGGERGFATGVLSQPFGRWILGAVAVGTAAYGVHELLTAYREKFLEREKIMEMSLREQQTIRTAGRAGYAAKGIVFLVIAYFFFRAALESDASEARGFEGAFRFLRDSPTGPWLLGLVALGIAAYGVYLLMDARYHRIRVQHDDRER